MGINKDVSNKYFIHSFQLKGLVWKNLFRENGNAHSQTFQGKLEGLSWDIHTYKKNVGLEPHILVRRPSTLLRRAGTGDRDAYPVCGQSQQRRLFHTSGICWNSTTGRTQHPGGRMSQ